MHDPSHIKPQISASTLIVMHPYDQQVSLMCNLNYLYHITGYCSHWIFTVKSLTPTQTQIKSSLCAQPIQGL